MENYIKYFFIILCGFYIFLRILNTELTKKTVLLMLVSCVMTFTIYQITKIFISHLSILIIIFSFLLSSIFILKNDIKTSLPLTIISMAISYIFASIALLIYIAIVDQLFLLIFQFDLFQVSMVLNNIIIAMFQVIMTFLFFKIKRLSRGIPGVNSFTDSNTTLFISISVLFYILLIEVQNIKENEILISIICFFLVFLGLTLFFILKIRFKKIYESRQTEIEMTELRNEIKTATCIIDKIKAENAILASVIHRDNKTIVALVDSVSEIAQTTTDVLSKKKLEDFHDYLRTEQSDRMATISNHDNLTTLQKTNIFAVDSIGNLMQKKATDFAIDFTFECDCDISELIAKSITENDLVTIIADLLENAIIATKTATDKKVALKFILEDGIFAMIISDTGIPFNPIVLENFGVKGITTHENDGGSGIGLVTIYNIVKKSKASIELFQEKNSKYLAIKFDENSNLTITNNIK